MTNKTTEALKLAEEALEYARSSSQNQEMWGYFNKALQGLYAIRAEDDPDIQYSHGYLDGMSAGKLEGRAEALEEAAKVCGR
jgi:hypothetical protein